MRIPNDVRRPLRFFSWQLPQSGSWPIPSRTSLPEPFVFANVQARNKAKFNSPLTSTFTQLFYADCRGHDLHDLRETARSPTTVTACQLAQQSVETQNCSRDNEDGLWRAGGWQPKSLRNSIWQGKPACWGRPRSPTAVVRAPVTSRGQPSFDVNRLTQISRASSCRRERFCQGGNRYRKVVLAVLRLRLATLMANVGCTTGSAKAATCTERSSCTHQPRAE